jgi:membrane-associated phospholipid phosphatase
MPHRLARLVSILGHPLLTLPLAVLALMAAHGPAGDSGRLHATAIAMALIAAGVMGYAWWQVKRERWTHVDASAPNERANLNRGLLSLLTALATLAVWRAMPDLALGFALSAALILIAMASARWCKLSLHVAFAAYAAGLLWALSPAATTAAAVFTATVAWSRLRLSRHRPRDIAAGAIAGVAAAAAYALFISRVVALWPETRV